jgi:hypothetical protein
MVFASFVHRETRPIGGIPDPFFHIDSYCMNAVFDEAEIRWKAGKFRNLKANAPFYEAVFNSKVAEKLIEAGYGIRRTERDFELVSVSRELIDKFSKRTKANNKLAKEQELVIEANARALAIQGMDCDHAIAKVKAEIGGKNRESKSAATLKPDELLANWRAQMTPGRARILTNCQRKRTVARPLGNRRGAGIDGLPYVRAFV